jgi:hypothetical protein
MKNNEILKEELNLYKPEVAVGLRRPKNWEGERSHVELVNHLWDDEQSIFHFDVNKLEDYLDSDRANMRGERKLDAIIDTMETKWDRMDRYWFQKNRHLDQKMRKKKDSPNYNPRQQAAWQLGPDSQPGPGGGPPNGGNPLAMEDGAP